MESSCFSRRLCLEAQISLPTIPMKRHSDRRNERSRELDTRKLDRNQQVYGHNQYQRKPLNWRFRDGVLVLTVPVKASTQASPLIRISTPFIHVGTVTVRLEGLDQVGEKSPLVVGALGSEVTCKQWVAHVLRTITRMIDLQWLSAPSKALQNSCPLVCVRGLGVDGGARTYNFGGAVRENRNPDSKGAPEHLNPAFRLRETLGQRSGGYIPKEEREDRSTYPLSFRFVWFRPTTIPYASADNNLNDFTLTELDTRAPVSLAPGSWVGLLVSSDSTSVKR
ncbi:hypothetical protein CC1G_14306 [Coprinopsis cinerea okayama7|uniref:Uncharacterized protein n=1 Tax=Coprinopsis cinerea (strain Okayama-7 / 130 / ATCC MYA-4618 / FGSC 9003) TaxID=240176 RepID=D6RLT2_COPC7|nr:hypothetical protein CC1G_14306 [Coprinopsis cinerea okayama7\|eukprot:XP_002911775.1 hypothetical protein CC1G_14306 [Coprinopsis cinerea okayama7\